ncbi:MAG TPA: glycosyltransferase family 4 protein [Burkholderiaceae bacterium]|jgi:glycosyltransferase involved in cell wall biosynthesis|nr:glycosyltransferase family 4 protein [Burkholderiaceae bacterium]
MENGKIKVWLPTVRTGTGSDVYMKRVARSLQQKGLTTEISWFPQYYEFVPHLLRRKLMPDGTDIIFANSWNGFAFKRPDIPLVITSFHPDFIASGSHMSVAQYIYHRFLIRHYETRSFRAANIITAISDYTASSLSGTSFADKVDVTHLWLDIDKFKPGASSSTPNKPFRLLFVGTLSFRKGADLLAPIMQQLGNDFHLDIVGTVKNGKNAPQSDNISYLGRLSDDELLRAYENCDALLFPSRWEGFGYTALEAMACEKPVITSNATALPEVVVDGVTGILCETGNVDAFSRACQRLSLDRNLAHAMGIAGRKRAAEQFSESKAVNSYVQLIERLITK